MYLSVNTPAGNRDHLEEVFWSKLNEGTIYIGVEKVGELPRDV